ncbi:MAG: alpha/beta hydrolase [Ignavibacteriaceae bacterium]|nr:alpha/beta hydrolase [Ignavibacteriaceae bacterium]
MKMKLAIAVSVVLMTLTGCSGGYLYTNAPVLEFEDVNYGYPVKKALDNPRVAYIDQGSGQKTILLVHGLASNAGFWRYTIDELSEDYRVIAVDLPGYGKSDKKSYPYSLTFYADVIYKLLKELKIDRVYFVGHSMGGQIGIHFSLIHPDMLEKLILASPAGVEPFQKGEGDWLRSVFSVSFVKATTEEGIRRNLSNNFYNWRDDFEWMVEERARTAKSKDFDEFAYTVVRCVNAMLDEPTSGKLEQIRAKTLIVYGENDGLIPNPYLNPGFTADVFKEGQRRIPDCELYEIPECGHMLQIEKPAEFTHAVLDFIKK